MRGRNRDPLDPPSQAEFTSKRLQYLPTGFESPKNLVDEEVCIIQKWWAASEYGGNVHQYNQAIAGSERAKYR